jgi:hypothetical protein
MNEPSLKAEDEFSIEPRAAKLALETLAKKLRQMIITENILTVGRA